MGRTAGRRTRTLQRPPNPPPAPEFNALTASAAVLNDLKQPVITNLAWQEEAWNYYTAGGEIWFAVNWRSNALSRVRLRAARLNPDSAEPEFVDEGPAAELVAQLAGGVGGQAALMKKFGQLLGVAGEGNLVVYDKARRGRTAASRVVEVRSNDDVRVKPAGRVRDRKTFEVRDGENQWSALPAESLVVRIWDPDPRESWRPTSMTRAALVYLREIDYYNRKIIAQLLSRLASNGFLLIPEEVTFPVNPAFKEAPDPFIAEIVHIASNAIKNPGSASAAIPIPLRVPSQYIELFRHLTVASEVSDADLANRDRAIGRLAATLDMPQEVVTGLGDTSHWNAAGLDAEGVKKHISPPAETICHGLTEGYLHPMLEASDADVGDVTEWIVWYDPSELTQKPDLSERGVQLNDKMLIDDEAARREAGFDESDAPTADELQKMLLRQRFIAGGAFDATALEVVGLLSGKPVPIEAAPPPTPPAAPDVEDENEGEYPQDGQGTDQPVTDNSMTAAYVDRVLAEVIR